MKWIVVADAAKARVFSTRKLDAKWAIVIEMEHPESREKISELYRDSPYQQEMVVQKDKSW